MKWFKHFSDAHDDEIMDQMIERFGVESYGVWWIILERIAYQMGDSNKTSVTYPAKTWRKVTKISPQKLKKVVSFLQENKKLFLETSEDLITIDCPKLLEIRDEWTKRQSKHSGVSQESLGSFSVTDTDTEEDIKNKHYARNRRTDSVRIDYDWTSYLFIGIETEHEGKWSEAYPAVNIQAEIKRAALWLKTNPKKKKKNYERFLTNWLSRKQERGGGMPSNQSKDERIYERF